MEDPTLENTTLVFDDSNNLFLVSSIVRFLGVCNMVTSLTGAREWGQKEGEGSVPCGDMFNRGKGVGGDSIS